MSSPEHAHETSTILMLVKVLDRGATPLDAVCREPLPQYEGLAIVPIRWRDVSNSIADEVKHKQLASRRVGIPDSKRRRAENSKSGNSAAPGVAERWLQFV